MVAAPTSRLRTGVILGLTSALAFGLGGPIIKPLLLNGWSPGAAVLGRIGIAAIVLVIPALIALRFDLRPLWRAKWIVLLYASFAVVATQVAFYAAIERIPVSTTLLIEYLAPVILVLLAWARTRVRPHLVVFAGAALAIGGLALVVGPTGGEALDPLGVLFAVIALTGLGVYYVVGDRSDADVPPVALAAAGFIVGAVILTILGLTGLVPLRAEFSDMPMLGTEVPWWIPLVLIGLISTVVAYVAGIAAITAIGTRMASFLGLSEVLFAAIVGWILIGETLGPWQIVGGVLIIAGIVLVRLDAPKPTDPSPVTETVPMADAGLAAIPITEPVAIVDRDRAESRPRAVDDAKEPGDTDVRRRSTR